MKLTDPIKSALATALWSFLGSFGLLAAGWVQQVAKWSSTSGHSPLPGLSVIGYALIGAIVSALSGLIAFGVRFAQSKNVLPGNAPAFTPGPAPVEVLPLGAPMSEVVPSGPSQSRAENLASEVRQFLADADTIRAALTAPVATAVYGPSPTDPSTVIGGTV